MRSSAGGGGSTEGDVAGGGGNGSTCSTGDGVGIDESIELSGVTSDGG